MSTHGKTKNWSSPCNHSTTHSTRSGTFENLFAFTFLLRAFVGELFPVFFDGLGFAGPCSISINHVLESGNWKTAKTRTPCMLSLLALMGCLSLMLLIISHRIPCSSLTTRLHTFTSKGTEKRKGKSWFESWASNSREAEPSPPATLSLTWRASSFAGNPVRIPKPQLDGDLSFAKRHPFFLEFLGAVGSCPVGRAPFPFVRQTVGLLCPGCPER